MNSINLVSGAKGGVGKSLFTMGILDYSRDRGPALLETDVTNPDVGKSYRKEVTKFAALDIAHEEGWIDLANFLAETENPVVINAAAGLGSSESVKNLGDGLVELGRDLRVFWVLNTQRDGLALLKSFLDDIGGSERIRVDAVRNGFFGDPEDFKLFNEKIRDQIIERGGSVLDFPALAKRCADPLYVDRLSILRAEEALPFGSRLELKRWRKLVHEMFESAGV
ncbi:MAG: putative mobilization protein (MobD) [Leptospirillum sp. Group IV 'UBA BS']|nr:MAG: putative mobilization protein (MobD) [Leptospirillum sp. Group IV 'UBA BS']